MKKSHSFLANIILLACASVGVSGLLLAPPYKRIGNMARDPHYHDGYGYERQTPGEQHLEMLKVRAEQRKALTDRKAEAMKRKAQLVDAKNFFNKNAGDNQTSFKKAFEDLYRKKKVTIADGVSYSFDAADTNQFVYLFAKDDADFGNAVRALKQKITTEAGLLTARIKTLSDALERDGGTEEARNFKERELAEKRRRVEKLDIYILLLEQATDKNTLRALLGLQKDIEAPDEELERLYQAVSGAQGDYAEFKKRKEDAIQNEIDQQEALLKEMENYDSVQNVLFRAFLPDEFDGVSATTVPGKIGLALAIPFVTSVRKSLDSEYEKITNRFVRYFGECFHDLMVAVGVASPLSAKKVASWSRMVTSYKKSMDNLAKGSSDSTDVAAAFGARAGIRQENVEATPKSDLAAQVNDEGEVDDVTDFIRHADPVYVRVSTDFVRQMRRQISLVFRRMSGESYIEQREVLSDILKMLDCVGYLATGSFKVYRQSGLTQVLNRDISACCEWLSAQLAMLKDLIDSEGAEDSATGSSSSSYAGKAGRLGADYN